MLCVTVIGGANCGGNNFDTLGTAGGGGAGRMDGWGIDRGGRVLQLQ